MLGGLTGRPATRAAPATKTPPGAGPSRRRRPRASRCRHRGSRRVVKKLLARCEVTCIFGFRTEKRKRERAGAGSASSASRRKKCRSRVVFIHRPFQSQETICHKRPSTRSRSGRPEAAAVRPGACYSRSGRRCGGALPSFETGGGRFLFASRRRAPPPARVSEIGDSAPRPFSAPPRLRE